MNIEKFEDVIAWQKAKQLAVVIYREFKLLRDFGFKDQIQRAAVSVCNNIAEGFERKSNKEFGYFLYISKGSCGEIRSMLCVAKELDYISEARFEKIHILSSEIPRILTGLIKKL